MPKKHHTGLTAVLTVLILALIAGSVFMIKLSLDLTHKAPETRPGQIVTLPTRGEEETEPSGETVPPTTMPEPEHVVSTFSIGSMGDLLMHKPIFDASQYRAQVYQNDGTYDFSTIFQYLKDYITPLDFAAVNLETTLAGTDNGYSYDGYPRFNCPDSIVDGARDAGFDMLLTANNHSYDTTMVGYKRTVETIREKGLQTLGTYASPEEQKWTMEEVNDIRVGMMCYTYATSATSDGRPSLNGNMAISEKGICNYFYAGNLQPFYDEVEQYLAEMEEAGADASVIYLHWGIEYQLKENEEQQKIAQKLCDLGVDVIIGGHPHVVQPIDLLESTVDPDHKTVIIYSMGNAVSNQRKGFSSRIATAHTEDGILFTVTFEKYSDGTVYLADVSVLPTWVNKFYTDNHRDEYNILPLDYSRVEEWPEMFSIGEKTYEAARASYDRTMEIVGEGLAEVQDYLSSQKTARDEAYLAQAMGNAA